MYRTQAQRIWSAEARAKVLYFFNDFSFETEEYVYDMLYTAKAAWVCTLSIARAL